jgi:hypothetical protein
VIKVKHVGVNTAVNCNQFGRYLLSVRPLLRVHLEAFIAKQAGKSLAQLTRTALVPAPQVLPPNCTDVEVIERAATVLGQMHAATCALRPSLVGQPFLPPGVGELATYGTGAMTPKFISMHSDRALEWLEPSRHRARGSEIRGNGEGRAAHLPPSRGISGPDAAAARSEAKRQAAALVLSALAAAQPIHFYAYIPKVFEYIFVAVYDPKASRPPRSPLPKQTERERARARALPLTSSA